MELHELAAMVKLYLACLQAAAVGTRELTVVEEAREACTYALKKVPGLAELVNDELLLLRKKSSPP